MSAEWPSDIAGTAAADVAVETAAAKAREKVVQEAAEAASAQGTNPTEVKTAASTAAPGEMVRVDISGGSVATKLPTKPADKTRCGLKIVKISGTPGSTSATLNCGGSDVFNITGGSTTLTLTALFQGLIVQYRAADGVWVVQSTDTPLGSALGAAKLGTDGTVGGPSGSALASSVRRSARASALGGIPCTTRLASLAYAGNGTELSNGTKLGETSIIKCSAVRACGGIRLVFGNWSKAGELAPENPIKVQAGVEAVEHAGTSERVVYPVTFYGQGYRYPSIETGKGFLIPRGGMIVSDIIPIELAAGESFYVRTYVCVEKEGEKWPLDLTTVSGEGEGVSTTNSNKAYTEAITASNSECYSPVAIIAANSPEYIPVIGLVGDSIISGKGDAAVRSPGWLLRALKDEWAFLKMSKGGDTAKAFSEALRSQSRMHLADSCTHAVVAYGTNDLKITEGPRTAAQVKENLTKIYEKLIRRGIKVYGATLCPQPKESSDGWKTVGGQTVATNNASYQEVNAWIREGAGGLLSGYIEVAWVVESSHGSGKWQAEYTTEGVHPAQATHEAIAATLTPATLFT